MVILLSLALVRGLPPPSPPLLQLNIRQSASGLRGALASLVQSALNGGAIDMEEIRYLDNRMADDMTWFFDVRQSYRATEDIHKRYSASPLSKIQRSGSRAEISRWKQSACEGEGGWGRMRAQLLRKQGFYLAVDHNRMDRGVVFCVIRNLIDCQSAVVGIPCPTVLMIRWEEAFVFTPGQNIICNCDSRKLNASFFPASNLIRNRMLCFCNWRHSQTPIGISLLAVKAKRFEGRDINGGYGRMTLVC
ncbi:hypothetical protein BDK51DRAFT_29362 [Blyttiomyces helicus]|uniref:Uncharacterized protein n=1 Tax=Blyttiomyces helicus TaxID=388810 RepID=A0A4P9WT26_9FUNG|nr:hypothetical protein BDK51DRAFT_29362 [Blyttiomyces helicus]|eukprot:RKO94480.1 hypothetical protein BDK51DRAFT_29362 [Blyttiomyces helicus]